MEELVHLAWRWQRSLITGGSVWHTSIQRAVIQTHIYAFRQGGQRMGGVCTAIWVCRTRAELRGGEEPARCREHELSSPCALTPSAGPACGWSGTKQASSIYETVQLYISVDHKSTWWILVLEQTDESTPQEFGSSWCIVWNGHGCVKLAVKTVGL